MELVSESKILEQIEMLRGKEPGRDGVGKVGEGGLIELTAFGSNFVMLGAL